VSSTGTVVIHLESVTGDWSESLEYSEDDKQNLDREETIE